ncbi:hypothetical protein QTI33_27080 [Variovorax sp. J22P271]|uniref:hypothetical protein n=1 Tax=Variovorax davisae TaxID=3053515 RepID=UPI0025782ECF|nr:hypothetical protein [Variovorax sp. J22P271]MDM0035826.1 hypothetical protein [Variovorax sp. J22P271]
MADPTTFSLASSASEPMLQPVLAFQQACFTGVLQLQQLQLQMLSAWQWPFSTVSQEMWDVWVAHFGGGVPIDA